MIGSTRESIRRWMGRMMQKTRPGLIVIISFTTAALIGAVLLGLPAASVGDPLSPVDALFTATSAVCVTGLIVVDTGSHFTMFGKSVILALIQLGGLGVMTFSVFFFLFLGKGIGMRQRWIVTEAFTPTPIREIHSLIGSIFAFTFAAEGVGALSLFLFWRTRLPALEALEKSVFHSISAFCNAGFSTYSTSFVGFVDEAWLNTTIMLLIILGGLGFPVIYEFRRRITAVRQGKRQALSLHSKMVLSVTGILIVTGALLFYVTGESTGLAGLSMKGKVLSAFFQSVTARTAGFNTVEMSGLGPAALFVLIILMFIGASPGSCGGGIKTTSLAVFAAIFKTKIAGRHAVTLFRRTIPEDVVLRVLSVFILAVMVVTAGLIALLITEMGNTGPGTGHFLSYLFEAVSAFGTVGLSTGITSSLTSGGKLVIIVLMMLGRVGLLTVAYVITRAEHRRLFKYAEEKVMIG